MVLFFHFKQLVEGKEVEENEGFVCSQSALISETEWGHPSHRNRFFLLSTWDAFWFIFPAVGMG